MIEGMNNFTPRAQHALALARKEAERFNHNYVGTEHLLLGHDIYQRACHAVMQIDLDDDEFALDVVQKVGPGGHYLAQGHTRAHLRASTALAITHVPASGGGYRDPIEVAREEAERLYQEYRPQPLAESLRTELARVLAAAEADLHV